MKIRSGFVSNSSSSSYVIALKKNNFPCPHCGRKDPDFLDMVAAANDHNDENMVSWKGQEVFISNIWNWIGLTDDVKKEIENYLNKSNEWEVAQISIAYNNEDLKDTFDNMKSSGNLIVLYDYEG